MTDEAAKVGQVHVPAGRDRFQGQRKVFGSRIIDFKVSTLDTNGGLSISEVTDVLKGGPARHLHHEQGEWFYVVESEYMVEVGGERYRLGPGDSVFAPRKLEHGWAHVGEGTGRLILALQPAGEIEAFFDELAKLGDSPQHEELQRVFSIHGLELTGPPLSIDE
ncbi:MAG: cupin domain-containing protein [Actinomycetota bacterium]|nr:cupin domain-containing protein [Actinomycetota bacterium]